MGGGGSQDRSSAGSRQLRKQQEETPFAYKHLRQPGFLAERGVLSLEAPGWFQHPPLGVLPLPPLERFGGFRVP